jgi:hypothetical protein
MNMPTKKFVACTTTTKPKMSTFTRPGVCATKSRRVRVCFDLETYDGKGYLFAEQVAASKRSSN